MDFRKSLSCRISHYIGIILSSSSANTFGTGSNHSFQETAHRIYSVAFDLPRPQNVSKYEPCISGMCAPPGSVQQCSWRKMCGDKGDGRLQPLTYCRASILGHILWWELSPPRICDCRRN